MYKHMHTLFDALGRNEVETHKTTSLYTKSVEIASRSPKAKSLW